MNKGRWWRVAFGALLSLIVGGSLVGAAVPAAAQSTIGVYVSYADSFRADATNFPTPWLGAPNTVVEGCAPIAACTYDAGAIRIVNNSPSQVTVNSIAVHLDTCTYTGWPSAVLDPGADLIVTQLSTGEGVGCTGPTPSTFDTSDIGPKSSDYVLNCTPDGLVPLVDVTVDGTTTTYADSGQVLNTGGVDGACSGNESTQWTKIGSQPCKGSLFTLTPATQTHQVLETATVIATFTNSCGQPLSDAAVDFSVLSGPNVGVTGPGITDANGQASFSYSSKAIGTDTLQANLTTALGQIPSNTVNVVWTVNFAPGGGAFVIGDREAVQNGNVYWWGAQWWKQDPMSTGLAPASFKGYELSNSSPWCGQTWTTRPGNSPHPPKSVPSLMAVIVSSHITKRGPVISGDIVGIVLVSIKPGYGPSPGHPGRGTVVAILCTSSPTSPSVVTGPPAKVTGTLARGKGATKSLGLVQSTPASPTAASSSALPEPVAATSRSMPPASGHGKALGRRR